MRQEDTGLTVSIAASDAQSSLVRSFELVALDGSPLPAWSAGAHIDLHLGNGLVRSYSLLGDPADTARYLIAVRRDEGGRGGSLYVHQQLQPGQVLRISQPRNAFALDETAPHTLLLAGGIGITPLLSMARRLTTLGKPWELVYCGRDRNQLAYIDHAAELAGRAGARFQLHIDGEAGCQLDIASVLNHLPGTAHAYCCGPAPMLDAFRAHAPRRPEGSLHWEYFAASPPAVPESTTQGFTVTLARSGNRQFHIPADSSILDVLLDAGIDVDYGCMEGVCGSCRTAVIAGQPEHRDFVLSDREKKAGDCIMLCCSRSRSPELVLDL